MVWEGRDRNNLVPVTFRNHFPRHLPSTTPQGPIPSPSPPPHTIFSAFDFLLPLAQSLSLTPAPWALYTYRPWCLIWQCCISWKPCLWLAYGFRSSHDCVTVRIDLFCRLSRVTSLFYLLFYLHWKVSGFPYRKSHFSYKNNYFPSFLVPDLGFQILATKSKLPHLGFHILAPDSSR